MTRCASRRDALCLWIGICVLAWLIWHLDARLSRLEQRPAVRIEHITVTNTRDVSAAVAGLERGQLPALGMR
jgi:hypothetical protein